MPETLHSNYFLIAAIIVFGAVVAIVLVVAINRKENEKAERAVVETSSKLVVLRQVNQKYHFNNVNSHYVYRDVLPSKQRFDNYNFEKTMRRLIANGLGAWPRIFQWIEENRAMSEQYYKEINRIYNYTAPSQEVVKQYKVSMKRYLNKEDELFRDLIQHPVTDTSYTIIINYTSPQGRNSYESSMNYNLLGLKYIYSQCLQEKEIKDSKEYQRKALTPTMRYNVMKRDGFRCVLCGATASQGAKLEVDHIVPVSKGGRTEEANLRTLCFECNRGKSGKYEEGGLN